MGLAVLMHGSWVGSLTFEKPGAAGELPGRWLGCAAGAGPRLAVPQDAAGVLRLRNARPRPDAAPLPPLCAQVRTA